MQQINRTNNEIIMLAMNIVQGKIEALDTDIQQAVKDHKEVSSLRAKRLELVTARNIINGHIGSY